MERFKKIIDALMEHGKLDLHTSAYEWSTEGKTVLLRFIRVGSDLRTYDVHLRRFRGRAAVVYTLAIGCGTTPHDSPASGQYYIDDTYDGDCESVDLFDALVKTLKAATAAALEEEFGPSVEELLALNDSEK